MTMTAIVLVTLAVLVTAAEFLSGTFILLGLGVALLALAGVAQGAPETGLLAFSAVGSATWVVAAIGFRALFRRTAVEDPNVYDRRAIEASLSHASLSHEGPDQRSNDG